MLKNNKHYNCYLQDEWNQYGEEYFTFSVVDVVDEFLKPFLNQLEQIHIEQYKQQNKSYNIAKGGGVNSRSKPMSEKQKKKIGQRNSVLLRGKKHRPESIQKMKDTHIGQPYVYTKCTNVINDDIAYQIKAMLIQGVRAPQVAKILNVPYKFVNNIVSSDAWKHVQVDGWDEFRANRKIVTKITKEERQNIINDYFYNHLSKPEIAEKYNRKVATIRHVIHEYNTIP